MMLLFKGDSPLISMGFPLWPRCFGQMGNKCGVVVSVPLTSHLISIVQRGIPPLAIDVVTVQRGIPPLAIDVVVVVTVQRGIPPLSSVFEGGFPLQSLFTHTHNNNLTLHTPTDVVS